MEAENTQPQDGTPTKILCRCGGSGYGHVWSASCTCCRDQCGGTGLIDMSKMVYHKFTFPPVDQPAVPDEAKLTRVQLQAIEHEIISQTRLSVYHELALAVNDAATEHAWHVFLKGIPVENLTAETQYAAAWGKHSRDEEVAQLRERLEELKVYTEGLRDKFRTAIEQRDAIRVQLRGLVEILRRVVPQPYYCEDCGYFAGADDDECCTACGAQLEISGFEAAIATTKEETDGN